MFVLARNPSDEQLASLASLPLVIGEIDRVDHVTIRIVVRDAGEAITEISSAMQRLGLEVVEATEHVVDYDEAFVRVVERHRASVASQPDVSHESASDGRRNRRSIVMSVDEQHDIAAQPDDPRSVAAPAEGRPPLPPVVSANFAGPTVRGVGSSARRRSCARARRDTSPAALSPCWWPARSCSCCCSAPGSPRTRSVCVRCSSVRSDRATRRCSTRPATQLDQFVDSQGFVNDKERALRTLDAGDTDLVVVFPDDPLASVLAGESATIEVFNREMDPIQQTAIGIATRMAVQEVNATVLSTIASDAQTRVAPAATITANLVSVAADIEARDPSDPAIADLLGGVEGQLDDLDSVIDGSVNLLRPSRPDAADTTGLLDARATVDDLRTQAADAESFDSAAFPATASTLADTVSQVTAIDPAVLVRPFTVDTSSVIGTDIDPTDYFTPAALALLLQHLALTFAALSLVRDRSTGLFELLRIGPLSSTQILIGKCAAYLCVGSAVAAALTASAVFLLGVPFSGEVAWFAAMVVGVLLASLSLGMVLSSISQTESQAVQFAMLTLLAALFFSGFVLGLDSLTYPVKLISWTLPVTYGIRSFQTVMLLGQTPSTEDIVGLSALVVVYGSIAALALRRGLRSS